jgi:hypothetical protein
MIREKINEYETLDSIIKGLKIDANNERELNICKESYDIGLKTGWVNGYTDLLNIIEDLLEPFTKKYSLEKFSTQGKIRILLKILEKLEGQE